MMVTHTQLLFIRNVILITKHRLHNLQATGVHGRQKLTRNWSTGNGGNHVAPAAEHFSATFRMTRNTSRKLFSNQVLVYLTHKKWRERVKRLDCVARFTHSISLPKTMRTGEKGKGNPVFLTIFLPLCLVSKETLSKCGNLKRDPKPTELNHQSWHTETKNEVWTLEQNVVGSANYKVLYLHNGSYLKQMTSLKKVDRWCKQH